MTIATDIDWSILEKLGGLPRFDFRRDRGEWNLYCSISGRRHKIDFSSCADLEILEECCYEVLAETGRDVELSRSSEGFWSACLMPPYREGMISAKGKFKNRLEAIIQLICKLKEIE